MTREEEIQIAKEKAFPITDNGRELECSCGASGFEMGVRWADAHPKRNNYDFSENDIEGLLNFILIDCDFLESNNMYYKLAAVEIRHSVYTILDCLDKKNSKNEKTY